MLYSTFYAKLIPIGGISGTKYSISITGITAIIDGQKTYSGSGDLYWSIKPKSSGTATITFKNDTSGEVIGTKTILVRSTSRANPTYTLTSSANSVNEGGTVTFTLDTSDIGIGSTFAYTVTGITAADLDTGSLTGDFTIGSDGTGTISFKLKADNLTEGTETLTVTVPSANNVSKSVTVNDTSIAIPTYTLTSNSTSVTEGGTITFTLTTTNVSDNTTVPYAITGVDLSDISLSSLSGNFTVQNNTATLVFNVLTDNVVEGDETLILTLTGKSVSKSVTIVDEVIADVTVGSESGYWGYSGESGAQDGEWESFTAYRYIPVISGSAPTQIKIELTNSTNFWPTTSSITQTYTPAWTYGSWYGPFITAGNYDNIIVGTDHVAGTITAPYNSANIVVMPGSPMYGVLTEGVDFGSHSWEGDNHTIRLTYYWSNGTTKVIEFTNLSLKDAMA